MFVVAVAAAAAVVVVAAHAAAAAVVVFAAVAVVARTECCVLFKSRGVFVITSEVTTLGGGVDMCALVDTSPTPLICSLVDFS
jgi:hypothetical protein